MIHTRLIFLRAGLGIGTDEHTMPVAPSVHAVYELLGLEPLYVANEGKLIGIVPPAVADQVVTQMRQHPLGCATAIIGTITGSPPGMIAAQTGIWDTQVVDMQIGKQLPRIC